MSVFGETTAGLTLYLAPLDSAHLSVYGYGPSQLSDLIQEKAEIVLSYLPFKYRNFYNTRVQRLILVDFASSLQTSILAPFPLMTNIVGYKNPCGKLRDFKKTEVVAVISGVTITFPSLAIGDRLVIDFDNDMSTFLVRPLVWATNVLAAIDLMSVVSGDTKTGKLLDRVEKDSERVFPWLSALNSTKIGDRIVIQNLEYEFWNGEKLSTDQFDDIFAEK